MGSAFTISEKTWNKRKGISEKMKSKIHILEHAVLPMDYENYVFDLYGTLVDVHTDESKQELWDKLCLFYGYYGAFYTPKELQTSYRALITQEEAQMKRSLAENEGESGNSIIRYAHESFPELEITDVFQALYTQKGVEVDRALAIHTGQFFRALATEYVKLYEGTEDMLQELKNAGKKIYLLSNAQRIFTAYEMNALGITKYFDEIMISSDYGTKKPDKRFFDLLTEKCHLDISKSIYVGNDSRCDVGGAKKIGMDTFYICSNISPENDSAPEATYQVPEFKKWGQTQ